MEKRDFTTLMCSFFVVDNLRFVELIEGESYFVFVLCRKTRQRFIKVFSHFFSIIIPFKKDVKIKRKDSVSLVNLIFDGDIFPLSKNVSSFGKKRIEKLP